MATRDFKVRNGLIVGGTLTLGGNTVDKILDSDTVTSIVSSSSSSNVVHSIGGDSEQAFLKLDTQLNAAGTPVTIGDIAFVSGEDSVAYVSTGTPLVFTGSHSLTIPSVAPSGDQRIIINGQKISPLSTLTASASSNTIASIRLTGGSLTAANTAAAFPVGNAGAFCGWQPNFTLNIPGEGSARTGVHCLVLMTPSSVPTWDGAAYAFSATIAGFIPVSDDSLGGSTSPTNIQNTFFSWTSGLTTTNISLSNSGAAYGLFPATLSSSVSSQWTKISNNFDSEQIVTIINENTTAGSIDSDVAAVAQLRRDADSDSIRIQEIATSLEQINELVDSDLKAIGDLRNDVDSDSIRIQDLQTQISSIGGLTDSDLKAVADLRNDVDSDSTKLQALQVSVDSLAGTAAINTTVYTYTATQGQTTFTGADSNGLSLAYAPGKIYVFLNGILILDTTDYTASNGTSIVLQEAADSDNTVQIIKHVGTVQVGFDSDQVANMVREHSVSSSFDSDQVVAIINENVVSGSVDSDVAAIAALRRDADSDSIRIQEIATSLEQINELVDSDLKAIADLRNDIDSDSISIQATKTDMDVNFIVASSGASAYAFTGDGFPSSVNNPTIYLNRGHTYNFRLNASGHPFQIRTSSGGSAYSDGVTNNSAQTGLVKFVVPMDAPDSLVYQCTIHSGMVGSIKIGNPDASISDSDLKVVADLRNDIDSDSAKLQALQEAVNQLRTEQDSDSANSGGSGGSGSAGFDSDQIVAIINENTSSGSGSGMTDSDLKVVADLRNEVDTLNLSTGTLNQNAKFTTFKYKTANNQTTISGVDRDNQTLSYTAGNINVFLNGVLLNDSDDYTATNGTQVVLGLAADSDDIVVIQKVISSFDSETVQSIWNNNYQALDISRFDFTATQGQTTFSGADDNSATLSYITNKIQVYLNGILLLRTTDYVDTSGTQIVLTQSADSDDKLTIIKYAGQTATENLTVTRFTYGFGDAGNGTVGSTTLTGADDNGNSLSYIVGKIQVFSNGILLEDSDDYIANNGTSIILQQGADSDDKISIIKYLGTVQTTEASTWTNPSANSYNAAAGDKLFIETASSAKTIVLPTSATIGDEIRIIDADGNAASNNITVSRNGHKIQGAASDLIINLNRSALGLAYYNVAQGWLVIEN